MAEYIEREALRNSIESIDWYSVYKGKLTTGATNTENALYKASSIYAIIDNAPAADVAPVVHGRWIFGKDLPYSWGQIPKNKYHLYCSECLEQAFNRSEDNDPDFDVDTSYCPNCGAKMDGGDGNSAMA